MLVHRQGWLAMPALVERLGQALQETLALVDGQLRVQALWDERFPVETLLAVDGQDQAGRQALADRSLQMEVRPPADGESQS